MTLVQEERKKQKLAANLKMVGKECWVIDAEVPFRMRVVDADSDFLYYYRNGKKEAADLFGVRQID